MTRSFCCSSCWQCSAQALRCRRSGQEGWYCGKVPHPQPCSTAGASPVELATLAMHIMDALAAGNSLADARHVIAAVKALDAADYTQVALVASSTGHDTCFSDAPCGPLLCSSTIGHWLAWLPFCVCSPRCPSECPAGCPAQVHAVASLSVLELFMLVAAQRVHRRNQSALEVHMRLTAKCSSTA